jgi:hypothetical protein
LGDVGRGHSREPDSRLSQGRIIEHMLEHAKLPGSCTSLFGQQRTYFSLGVSFQDSNRRQLFS